MRDFSRDSLHSPGAAMSEAIKSIVETYVGLSNRVALEEMLQHRHRLRNQLRLKTRQGYDFAHALRAFDEDVRAIEDGLARLRS